MVSWLLYCVLAWLGVCLFELRIYTFYINYLQTLKMSSRSDLMSRLIKLLFTVSLITLFSLSTQPIHMAEAKTSNLDKAKNYCKNAGFKAKSCKDCGKKNSKKCKCCYKMKPFWCPKGLAKSPKRRPRSPKSRPKTLLRTLAC